MTGMLKRLAMAVCLCAGIAAAPAPADSTLLRLDLPGGKVLEYVLVTPDDFKPDQAYPVMVLFPGGPQTMTTVTGALQFVDPVCRERGWVVVSPAAPDMRHFYDGAQEYVWPLLSAIRKRVTVEGGKFHAAGISNGGLSAFRVAMDRPEQFHSVFAFPGHPASRDDLKKLDRLKGIPVRMFVGSDDRVEWKDEAKRAAELGKKAGLDISVEIRPAQGHIIEDLEGAPIFDVLDKFRKREGTMTRDAAAAAEVLDQLHDAASKAEEARYFDLFAPEGVFIGTDATERWTVEQFRAYAAPIFSKGKGWTYISRVRHVDLSPDKTVAWFDELLDNEKYGVCRGTGVLRLIDGRWKIAQYHLTVPVPNDLMERVAKMIKAAEPKPKK